MKKILSVMAVSAFVLTASVVFAGGPGKQQADAGCPEPCQQQIDDLQSSQAQQNEQLGGHGKQLENHEGRITTLEKDAYNPWYARVGARAAWMDQDINIGRADSGQFLGQRRFDSDMGWGGALAFGRQFGQFRTELELAHQKADLDDRIIGGIQYDGDVSVSTVMANSYYEIPVADAFAVYGMAGLGYAKYDLTVNRTLVDGSDNVFAYKAGAGVTYNFADNMAADLGYEFLGVADTDMANSINGHNVVASFRYKF